MSVPTERLLPVAIQMHRFGSSATCVEPRIRPLTSDDVIAACNAPESILECTSSKTLIGAPLETIDRMSLRHSASSVGGVSTAAFLPVAVYTWLLASLDLPVP